MRIFFLSIVWGSFFFSFFVTIRSAQIANIPPPRWHLTWLARNSRQAVLPVKSANPLTFPPNFYSAEKIVLSPGFTTAMPWLSPREANSSIIQTLKMGEQGKHAKIIVAFVWRDVFGLFFWCDVTLYEISYLFLIC